MEKKVQAQFQCLKNAVKEFSIECKQAIDSNEDINVKGELGFKVTEITEKDDAYIGQIELTNDILVLTSEKKEAKIHIVMIGVFKGEIEIDKNKFEDMLKINGSITLSHLMRSYVQVVTSLSGMPTIITPMINFVEFFKQK